MSVSLLSRTERHVLSVMEQLLTSQGAKPAVIKKTISRLRQAKIRRKIQNADEKFLHLLAGTNLDRIRGYSSLN